MLTLVLLLPVVFLVLLLCSPPNRALFLGFFSKDHLDHLLIRNPIFFVVCSTFYHLSNLLANKNHVLYQIVFILPFLLFSDLANLIVKLLLLSFLVVFFLLFISLFPPTRCTPAPLICRYFSDHPTYLALNH